MDERPLIAIFCSSFPPEGGGASARIYNLAVLLRDAGYRVQVVCAMPNYPTGSIYVAYEGAIVANETEHGIPVKRVWISPSNKLSALSRSWSMASFVLSLKMFAYRQVRKMEPALVIVSSPPLPMASATVRYFKKHSIRVLLNVSDIWPLSANALGAMGHSKLYDRLEAMASRMYQAADAITAQSEETLQHIRKHCATMPPAMLYRNLPEVSGERKRVCKPRNKKKQIIYPGVLGHAQGLLALCQAIDFASLNVELHIYGEGPESGAIADLIKANSERGIFLYKPVTPSALLSLLEDFHAVLVPLVAPIEGALPSKLFTALQAGIPVLYSGGGEGAAIVNNYKLGWTAAPGDYASIAMHICALTTMGEEDYEDFRKRILQVADEHFNKQRQDGRFLNFLSGILNNNIQ